MSTIAAAVLELADAIKKDLTVNDTAIGVIAEKDPYYSNIPENLTKENVDDTHAYDRTFLAASTKAIGDMAIDHMKEHKKVTLMTGCVNMGDAGKGRFNTNEVTLHKDFEVRIPSKDGESATKVKPLHVVSKLTVIGTGSKSGAMGAVLDGLTEVASEAFAKK